MEHKSWILNSKKDISKDWLKTDRKALDFCILETDKATLKLGCKKFKLLYEGRSGLQLGNDKSKKRRIKTGRYF